MKMVKVWDPVVRAFHWALVLVVAGSFVTSDVDALVPVHVRLGLAMVALVVTRLAWGLVGPRHARFSDFVRGPRAVLAYARGLVAGRPPHHLGHNPLGGAMVVALLAVLLGLAATGVVAYGGPQFEGPFSGAFSLRTAKAIKEVHEALSGALLALVAVHLAGVLASSLVERQNLVLGMVTGLKRAPEDGAAPGLEAGPAPAVTRAWASARRLAGAATALTLGAAAAIALALLLGLPGRAHAAGPLAADLLREWEAAARAARPAFAGFSAAEGRRIYATEHQQDGQRVSCATCHTPDPRQGGRTPAGKLVEPLSPVANPARLTDRADVEKWFKRNCKQVLGRECSAEEKGHFVTYLLAP